MRWVEGAARARLTEPSCGRKVNMLANLNLSQALARTRAAVADVPDAVPRRKLTRCAESGSLPTWRCPAPAKLVGVTTWWLQSFPFDDCAIIRRFYLSAAGFGNVPFRLASTVDSLLSPSVGSPEECGQWSGRNLK